MNKKMTGTLQIVFGLALGALWTWLVRSLETPDWHEGMDWRLILSDMLVGAAVLFLVSGLVFLIEGFWRARHLRRFLPPEALDDIARAVAAAEAATSGEIRVAMRFRRTWREAFRKEGVDKLALQEFRHLKLEQTRDRTGVLLFVLLSRRRFRILGDAGIHARIGQETWNRIAARISQQAAGEGLGAALAAGVGEIGRYLAEHFPRPHDDTNELPDEVSIR